LPRLRLLPSTKADLVDIFESVARQSGSVAIAERLVARLRRRCRELAALPGTLGRPRPELLPEMRSFAHGEYVIFFRYHDGAFEVINILHGHRDIDRLYDG
jgi:plasmid stabilization system protein ParE